MGNMASASNGGAAFGDFSNATCPTCAANVSSATAIGNSASATTANSVAVGQSASVLAVNGTAIGAGAVVQSGATNAVAIGQGSIASAPNTVSFGSPGNERRLTNVAAGIAPTDAVNVAQLNSVATGMSSQIGGLQAQVNRANSGVAMAMAMGGGFLPDNKKFAVAANYGAFAGESGLALIGLRATHRQHCAVRLRRLWRGPGCGPVRRPRRCAVRVVECRRHLDVAMLRCVKPARPFNPCTTMWLSRSIVIAAIAGPIPAVAQQPGQQPSEWAKLPRMQLERQFAGPLQDTIVQRWRDPVDGMICYIYLPITAAHSAPMSSGYVQYGANTIGSISCLAPTEPVSKRPAAGR